MKTKDKTQAKKGDILKDTKGITTVRYCGRDFSMEEMRVVCEIVKTNGIGRTAISEKICEDLQWLKADGKLKDMSCRVALLRMEKDNWFKLPAPLRRNSNGKQYKHNNRLKENEPSVNLPAGKIEGLSLEQVKTSRQSEKWNEMIHRWHYLGYKKLVGSQLRYLINSSYGTLGALGFSASAWNVQAREEFIGWSRQDREGKLHLIVNNSRFLILPWIKSKNLASKILSLVARKLPDDWEERYKFRPVMLETFVEKERFSGACYKAANWICVGETKGRGKLGDHSMLYKNVKLIMLYPLCREFRSVLVPSIT